MLNGKRVALYSNHTGILGDKIFRKDGAEIINFSSEIDKFLIPFENDADGNDIVYGEHILDALLERNVNVVAIFCLEHGFRGTEDAGANIDNSVDEKTRIPILSLYANNTDTLVVNMQDVGLRYYTYYITLYYLMDACAATGKEVIVLDRPNPNGFYVNGPILKGAYKSGVGQLPIPIVYGMTCGELNQMINGEGWLNAGKNACKLTMILCKNYSHETKTSLIRRPFPNLKDIRAVYLYSSTYFFENTLISVGRGTDFPFEVYGSPYLKDIDEFDFSFTPRNIDGALNPPSKGEVCYGVDLRNIPIEDVWNNGINPEYLVSAHKAVKTVISDESFWEVSDDQGRYWLDKLSASDALRTMVE